MSDSKIIKAPYIDQTKDWPTGCECVSTVMLLQYLGYPITMEEFVDRYVEKVPFETIDGKLYGADPRVHFAGNPKDPESMGCHAPVICKALEKFFAEKQACDTEELKPCKQMEEVVNLTGLPMARLLKEYIDKDMPVIFWASIDLKETIFGPTWIVKETGQPFSWVSNEHCMLLVGYDETNYYFNDPWHNHGLIGYDRDLVEKRHAEEFSMAVSVK